MRSITVFFAIVTWVNEKRSLLTLNVEMCWKNIPLRGDGAIYLGTQNYEHNVTFDKKEKKVAPMTVIGNARW